MSVTLSHDYECVEGLQGPIIDTTDHILAHDLDITNHESTILRVSLKLFCMRISRHPAHRYPRLRMPMRYSLVFMGICKGQMMGIGSEAKTMSVMMLQAILTVTIKFIKESHCFTRTCSTKQKPYASQLEDTSLQSTCPRSPEVACR